MTTQTLRRVDWFAAVCLAVLISAGCDRGEQSKNQNTARPAPKSARWEAQYRSPASLKRQGIDVGFFYYSSISVVSPSIVFVVGDVPGPKGDEDRIAVILRTIDGGQSWIEKKVEQPGIQIARLTCVRFISPQTGWAVGADLRNNGVLLKTGDGGENWTVTRLTADQVPMTVFFVDETTGWIGGATLVEDDDESAGGPSVILGTTDGGASWQPQINTPASIYDIFFVDRLNGWASGTRGSIYRTEDGGRSWNSQRSELELAEGPINLQSEGMKLFNIRGIHFIDLEHGFAAAGAEREDAGLMLATDNGGVSWRRQWIVADSGVRDVFFVDAQEGWAVTDRGQYIYHTTDGGRSWLAEPKVFEQDVTMVRLGAADSNHVWAVGGAGIFVRVTD